MVAEMIVELDSAPAKMMMMIGREIDDNKSDKPVDKSFAGKMIEETFFNYSCEMKL